MSGLIAEFAPYVVGFIGLLVAFFGYRGKVVRDAKDEVRDEYSAQHDEYYKETRKDMDNAKPKDISAADQRQRLQRWGDNRGKPGK